MNNKILKWFFFGVFTLVGILMITQIGKAPFLSFVWMIIGTAVFFVATMMMKNKFEKKGLFEDLFRIFKQ